MEKRERKYNSVTTKHGSDACFSAPKLIWLVVRQPIYMENTFNVHQPKKYMKSPANDTVY